MTISTNGSPQTRSRVLILSQRNLCEVEVWRSNIREFEQIIAEIDSVDLLAPRPLKWFKRGERLAMRVGKHSRIVLNPGVARAKLDRDYELFATFCEKPSELLSVDAALGDWRRWCKTSVCWLNEFWVKDIPRFKSSVRVLSKFDYVFTPHSQSVEPIQKMIAGKCIFAPLAVDTVRFFPYATPVNRSIDVLSIGRRSVSVHQALLKMAREEKIFYVYDTIADLHTADLEQHRFLLTSLAKRSRYFTVGPAKFDSPQERGEQNEIGLRFFEGAAAGTIMIGERPRNENFQRAFPSAETVIELPDDPGAIESALHELDREADWQERQRRINVAQALRRHDWVYRWETILSSAGMPPLSQLRERKQNLMRLADMAERSTAQPLGGRGSAR